MEASTDVETTPLIDSSNSSGVSEDVRRPHKTRLAIRCILASILFEAAAYYTLEANLLHSLTYNETLNWNPDNAEKIKIIFNVTDCIFMMIFAIISDVKLNRARVIKIGFPIYLIGYVLSAVFANGTSLLCSADNHTFKNSNSTLLIDEQCVHLIIPTTIITAISVGTIRANIIAFGVDQIQDSRVTSRYIDQLIVIFNLAVILQTIIDLTIPFEQDSKYYVEYYSIGVILLLFSALIFFCGQRYYYHIKPSESVISNYIPVYKYAFQRWLQFRKRKTKTTDTNSLNVNAELAESLIKDHHPRTFLDHAKIAYNGKYQDWIVADVQLFQKALIIVALVLPYWFVVYNSVIIFESQSAHMTPSESSMIREIQDLFSIIEPITVILGIGFLNCCGYKLLNKRNLTLTTAKKLILSMCFGTISMCITGGIEIVRLQQCIDNSTSSNLSVYVQFPQHMTMGLSRLFGLLAILEFICFIAPRSTRSIFFGLYFFSRFVAGNSAELLSRIPNNFDFKCPTLGEPSWFSFTWCWCFILAIFQLIFIFILFICQNKIRLVNLNRRTRENN